MIFDIDASLKSMSIVVDGISTPNAPQDKRLIHMTHIVSSCTPFCNSQPCYSRCSPILIGPVQLFIIIFNNAIIRMNIEYQHKNRSDLKSENSWLFQYKWGLNLNKILAVYTQPIGPTGREHSGSHVLRSVGWQRQGMHLGVTKVQFLTSKRGLLLH